MRTKNEQTTKNRCPTVEKKLIPAKFTAFLFTGSIAVSMSYFPLHLKQIGLTATETGVIFIVIRFISCLTTPLIGAFADKFKRQKLTTILACVASILFTLSCLTVKEKNMKCPQNFNVNADNGSELFQINGNTIPGNFTYNYNTLENKKIVKIFPKRASSLTSWCSGSNDLLKKFQYCNLNSNNSSCFIRNSNETVHEDIKITSKSQNYSCFICPAYNSTNVVSWKNNNTFKLYCFCDNNNADNRDPEFGTQFVMIVILLTLGTIWASSIGDINNAMIYGVLGDSPQHWGRQQTWGEVGYMTIGLTTAILIDSFHKDSVSYEFSFYAFGICMILIAVCVYFYQLPATISVPSFFKASRIVFKNSELTILFFNVTIFGMYFGTEATFKFWHIFLKAQKHNVENVKQLVIGLTLTTDGITAVLLLYYSGKILKKLGYMTCTMIASLSYGITHIIVSEIANPWLTLLTGPPTAIGYSLTLAIMTSIANKESPPGFSTYTQCLAGAFFWSLGRGLGDVLSGFLFDTIGGDWTFRLYAISAMTLMPFLIIGQHFMLKYMRKKRDPPQINDFNLEMMGDEK